MGKVEIDASKIWDLFQKEKATLGLRMREIATNPDKKVVIMLTTVGESGEEQPDIIVSVDDKDFYEVSCIGRDDCEETVRAIYEKYLFGKDSLSNFEEEDEYLEEEFRESEIETREEEIERALYNFLDVVLEGSTEAFPTEREYEYFDDCKEHFLEYINRRWGLEIRRPMYLEDENGKADYYEFPYELLEFDDEDDPIYYGG